MNTSPSVVLDLELRRKADFPSIEAPTNLVDPGTTFAKKCQRAAKRYQESAKAERILHDHQHAQVIAPILAAPGAAYAIKRLRDHDWKRFFGERRKIDPTFYDSKSTRQLLGALTHPRFSHLTFSEFDLADFDIDRLEALVDIPLTNNTELPETDAIEVEDED